MTLRKPLSVREELSSLVGRVPPVGRAYDATYARLKDYRAEARRLRRLPWSRDEGTTFVDLACGTGLLLAELAKVGSRTLVGIDINPVQLDLAKERGIGARFVRRDMFKLKHSDIRCDQAVLYLGFSFMNILVIRIY